VRASINRQNEAGTRLRVAAKGLRKGQLAAWCEAAGIRPDAVFRARLGRLPLGTLATGQWRLMMGYERF
jgi:23S rRNA pseudouridine2604 synthase